MLSENLGHYISLYDRWSRYEPETEGVLVAYASIYGGTAQAARRLASMLEEAGAGEVWPFANLSARSCKTALWAL